MNKIISGLISNWLIVSNQWEDTKTLWMDSQRVKFEKYYWTYLNMQVQVTVKKMEQLEDILNKARRNVK